MRHLLIVSLCLSCLMLVDHSVGNGPVSRALWASANRAGRDFNRTLEQLVAVQMASH